MRSKEPERAGCHHSHEVSAVYLGYGSTVHDITQQTRTAGGYKHCQTNTAGGINTGQILERSYGSLQCNVCIAVTAEGKKHQPCSSKGDLSFTNPALSHTISEN